MNHIVGVLIILSTSYLSGMEQEQRIKIILADDSEVFIPKSIARQSGIVRNMLTDLLNTQPNSTIALPHITPNVWRAIIEPAMRFISLNQNGQIDSLLLSNLATSHIKEAIEQYIEIINSADFLDIEALLDHASNLFALYLIDNNQVFLKHPNLITLLDTLNPLVKEKINSFFRTILFKRPQSMLDATQGGHTASVTALAFSPIAPILISGSNDKTVKVWDLTVPSSPKLVRTIAYGYQGYITSLAYNRTGEVLAMGSQDKTIRLLDTRSANNPQTIAKIDKSRFPDLAVVRTVSFSPTRDLLAAGLSNGKLKLWDVTNLASPDLVTTIEHRGAVRSVAFAQSGDLLASESYDKKIRIWDISNPRNPRLITTIDSNYTGSAATAKFNIAFDPVNMLLVAGSADNTVPLWDLTNPAALLPLPRILQEDALSVYSVAFNKNGRLLGLGSNNGILGLWNISNPEKPRVSATVHTNPQNPINTLVFDPKRAIVTTGFEDGTIALWRYTPEKHRLTLLQEVLVYALQQYLKTEKRLFIVDNQTLISLMETFDQEQRQNYAIDHYYQTKPPIMKN